jgi:Uri superfamily endonuclease
MWTRTLTPKAASKLLNALKGIYVLIIQVDRDINVNVGALGMIPFTKGLYAYVGSAQANLEQRVKRHFRSKKRLFWHIDYLLANEAAKIIKVLHKQADKTEECRTAIALSERNQPIAGFGCSDCNCKSHLFRIDDYKFLMDSMQPLSMFS